MNLFYLIRKYSFVRFLIFVCLIGGIVSGIIFFSRSTIRANVITAVSLKLPCRANGKTTEKARSYAFRSIWEEATPNISGYSALWRTPKITGVY